jgi:hypothetical protein
MQHVNLRSHWHQAVDQARGLALWGSIGDGLKGLRRSEMIRQRPYRIGSKLKVHNCDGGYHLPDWLKDGDWVKVLEISPGYRTVEKAGQRYEVAMACIDSGWIREE